MNGNINVSRWIINLIVIFCINYLLNQLNFFKNNSRTFMIWIIRFVIFFLVDIFITRVFEKQSLFFNLNQSNNTNNNTNNNANTNNNGILVNDSWKVVSINSNPIEEKNPTLEFNRDKENSEIRVGGFAGCNRYFSSVTFDDSKSIKFGPIGSTMMACPPPQMDQETQFLQSMEKVSSYQISDDRLVFLNSNQKPIMELVKE